MTFLRLVVVSIAINLGASVAWSTPEAAHYSEWSEPINAGTPVNSPSPDIAPTLSKDELSLFFSSTRPGGAGGFDIWVSQRSIPSNPWGAPRNLGPAVNTGSNDQGTALSRDGHFLFFVSDRPGGFGGQDIWVSWRAHTRDDFAWQPPVNLGSGVNSDANEHGPGYFENDDEGVPLLYFGSDRPGGLGLDDIYVAELTREGSFGAASVVLELSTPFADVGPDVRRDGREIYFHSNRPGSLGLFDLWVATREAGPADPGTPPRWSGPTNLGAAVNRASNEGQPAISTDGDTIFLFSNRPGGVGGADLYFATRDRVTPHNGNNHDAESR